ncbi:hypothetical protein L195_g027453, partial [Trifolium pratense]
MVKGNSLYCKKEMEDIDFGKFRLHVAQGIYQAHGAVGQLGAVRGASDLARNAADLT